MEKSKKAFHIALIVFGASVLLAILLDLLKLTVGVDYKKVSAQVESMEVINSGTRKHKSTEYKAYVNYNGKSYRVQNLNNVKDWNRLKPDKTVDMYLCDGEIYASVNSIVGDTPMGRVAFMSIIASMIVFFIMIFYYDAYWKEKKKINNFK
ncbi:MAG: hypothetical protein E7263_11650 [Lachnospiraceae bacterium]|nr:hypothetical protein [Lachnospiraceae bacterium]